MRLFQVCCRKLINFLYIELSSQSQCGRHAIRPILLSVTPRLVVGSNPKRVMILNIFMTLFVTFCVVKCFALRLSFIHESSYVYKCDTIWKRKALVCITLLCHSDR
jgi:hypothetical protein